MKRFLLAPLIFALSSPLLAAEKKLTARDINNLGIHTGGLTVMCVSYSKGFISKKNMAEMVTLVLNKAKLSLEPINEWKPFKAAMRDFYSKSVCDEFVYLLKD